MPQLGEDRLHRRHSRCVEFSSALAVDCDFHALGEFERRALVLLEEGHLSGLGPLRMAQAFIPEVARHAVAFRAVELVVLAAVRGAVAPVGVERLAGCHLSAYRSHWVFGIKEPADFRRNGASAFSAYWSQSIFGTKEPV